MDALRFTIGQAARQAGVGVETIRFYERRGLIARPPRLAGAGIRRYDPGTVERIRFIRQAQGLGFALREIEELLALQADPKADAGDVRRRALAKIEEVNSRIARLGEIRDALIRLLAACPGSGALGACSILEAMSAPKAPRTKKRGAMKNATFRIEGMHCEGCAKTIEALLGAEAGVERAAVSFEAREATVDFDPNALDERRIAASIERAGYKVLAAAK